MDATAEALDAWLDGLDEEAISPALMERIMRNIYRDVVLTTLRRVVQRKEEE